MCKHIMKLIHINIKFIVIAYYQPAILTGKSLISTGSLMI